MRGVPGFVGVVAVAVLVAGCTATAPSVAPPSVAASRAVQPATPAGPSAATFGSTHRWPGGLSIRVGRPASYWPSGWVREVNSFDHFLSVQVTLKNGSRKTVDLTQFEANGRSHGRAADPAHDPGKLGAGPPAKLAKGATAVFRLGFGVAKRSDFTLTVVPAPGMTPVVFSRR